MRPEARSPVAAGTAIGADRSVSIGSDGTSIPHFTRKVEDLRAVLIGEGRGKERLRRRLSDVERLLSFRAEHGVISDLEMAAQVAADIVLFVDGESATALKIALATGCETQTAVDALAKQRMIMARRRGKYRTMKDVTAGKKLELTSAERDELAIRSMGAVDEAPEERAARKRSEKRLRDKRAARARRAGKHTPRGLSNEALKPWEMLGVGRTKWYGLQKQARTSLSPITS